MGHPRVIHTQLTTGAPVCLRPIRPEDEGLIQEGISQLSDRSRYLRFFSRAESLPPTVVKRLADADGKAHIAWGAINSGDPEKGAIGACHAIQEATEHEADLAIAILDDWHGQGLARMLLAALAVDCLRAGLTQLTASVLAENKKARGLFKALGGVPNGQVSGVINYVISTEDMLNHLRGMTAPDNHIGDVLTALGG